MSSFRWKYFLNCLNNLTEREGGGEREREGEREVFEKPEEDSISFYYLGCQCVWGVRCAVWSVGCGVECEMCRV